MSGTRLSPDLAELLLSLTKALTRTGSLEAEVQRLSAENASLKVENSDLKAEMQDYVLLNDQEESEIDRLRARIAELERPESLRRQA